MQVMNDRIKYLDVAKGVLILLLLLWHFGDVLRRNGLDDANPYFLPVYIVQPLFYPFFMQAFFMLSGYCTRFDVSFKMFVVKNLKSLLLPWMIFEVIRLFYCIIRGNFANSVITRPEFTSLWFLNALFIGKMLAWEIYNISNKRWFILSASFVLLVAGVVLYNARICPNYFFFEHGMVASFLVIVGYLLKQNEKVFDVLIKFSWIVYIMILGSWKVCHFNLPFSTACLNVQLTTIPLYVLISVVGTFSLLLVCRKIGESNFLEYFGRNTLVMYGIHFIPYEIIIRFLSCCVIVDGWLNGIIFVVSAIGLEIILCVAFIWIFNTKYLQYAIGKF